MLRSICSLFSGKPSVDAKVRASQQATPAVGEQGDSLSKAPRFNSPLLNDIEDASASDTASVAAATEKSNLIKSSSQSPRKRS